MKMNMHEGHVYLLWPCPKGKAARKETAEIIKN